MAKIVLDFTKTEMSPSEAWETKRIVGRLVAKFERKYPHIGEMTVVDRAEYDKLSAYYDAITINPNL